MDLCNKNKCSGCGACFNACPNDCISMVEQLSGFMYPVIDKNKCIECGLCVKSCPEINTIKLNPVKKVFAFSNSNDNSLMNSSSGGAAYYLSKKIIGEGGVVFGAIYDEKMVVRHIAILNLEDLKKAQGSKYVQSDQGFCYKEAKQYLQNGKKVLYIGMPCQIAGLKKYLDEDYENLITCDLFCGGVPSPKVFKKYILYLQAQSKDKISNINFRNKKYGYKFGYLVSIKSGDREKILSSKNSSFVKSIGLKFVRESCFDCKFASKDRIGDISLGDFWKIKFDNTKDKKGISLITVNSPKGLKILEKFNDCFIEEHSFDEYINSQGTPIKGKRTKPKNYDKYFSEVENLSWKDLRKKYYCPTNVKNKISESMPIFLLAKIRKIIKRVKY